MMVFLVLSTIGFWVFVIWLAIWAGVEKRWPNWVFTFTKFNRLKRKELRLRNRVMFLEETHPIYTSIRKSEQKLADLSLKNPSGFLDSDGST